jgi:hypothetical protein
MWARKNDHVYDVGSWASAGHKLSIRCQAWLMPETVFSLATIAVMPVYSLLVFFPRRKFVSCGALVLCLCHALFICSFCEVLDVP